MKAIFRSSNCFLLVCFLMAMPALASETLLHCVQDGHAYRQGRIQARVIAGEFYRSRPHPDDARWVRILIDNRPHEAESRFFVSAEERRQALASAVNRAKTTQSLLAAANNYTRYYKAMLSHQGYSRTRIAAWEREYMEQVNRAAEKQRQAEQMEALERRVRAAEAAARDAESRAWDAWIHSIHGW